MAYRLCQIVLFLIVAMVLLSPFTQQQAWDSFPVGSDDLELQITCSLSGIGILLVLAQLLKLVPALARSFSRLATRSVAARLGAPEESRSLAGVLPLLVPLRI